MSAASLLTRGASIYRDASSWPYAVSLGGSHRRVADLQVTMQQFQEGMADFLNPPALRHNYGRAELSPSPTFFGEAIKPERRVLAEAIQHWKSGFTIVNNPYISAPRTRGGDGRTGGGHMQRAGWSGFSLFGNGGPNFAAITPLGSSGGAGKERNVQIPATGPKLWQELNLH
jgi:hypothetical protein